MFQNQQLNKSVKRKILKNIRNCQIAIIDHTLFINTSMLPASGAPPQLAQLICEGIFILAVFSGYTIPIDYTQEPVNVDSRLAMLLPSLRGWGLCSVALVYYLQELQNNFLENYSKERKQT